MKILKKYWPVILIVFLALFFRLYRLPSYMTFLGDEGRDALVWLRMTRGKFTLIGPQTSIGNMYLGPLFYYLMFPFYLLLGTAGPSIGTALLAGGTAFLLWKIGKEWFSERAGLIAAFLYAVSPVAIVLSRSAWNPNIMPFFAILIGWGIWQFWQKDNFFWLVAVGFLLSVAVQSHYLGLLLIPIVLLFWIVSLFRLIKSKSKEFKKFILFSVLGSLFFILLTVMPLVWFDLRHGFINYQSFYKFFSERQTTVNFKLYKALPNLWPLWQMLVTRLLAGTNVIAGFWLAIFLFLSGLIIFIKIIRQGTANIAKNAILFLLSWLFVGLLGMGLYKQHIYDHYFGFLFPPMFLLGGAVFSLIWQLGKAGKAFLGMILFSLMILAFIQSPLKYPPGKQMEKTAQISWRMVEISQGRSFNLGLIAKQNYDAGYRYFLEKWGYPPLTIDAQKVSTTVTDQLFVVCEDKVCQPVGHPQAEIANFGWVKIEDQWEFPWGTKLYKLGHFNDASK